MKHKRTIEGVVHEFVFETSSLLLVAELVPKSSWLPNMYTFPCIKHRPTLSGDFFF